MMSLNQRAREHVQKLQEIQDQQSPEEEDNQCVGILQEFLAAHELVAEEWDAARVRVEDLWIHVYRDYFVQEDPDEPWYGISFQRGFRKERRLFPAKIDSGRLAEILHSLGYE